MKNITFCFIVVCSAMLFACNENSNQTSKTEQNIDQHDHDVDEKIVLNHGKKWKVDAPMLKLIRLMENDIQNFSGSDTIAFNELSAKLNKNIEDLTSNCTMTGQAHDELHKWLLPFIDLTSELQEENELDDLNEVFADLKKSFITFNQFFE